MGNFSVYFTDQYPPDVVALLNKDAETRCDTLVAMISRSIGLKELPDSQMLTLVDLDMATAVFCESSRPYFKPYGDYVSALSQTSLDVPVEYCKLPYAAFDIRLEQGTESAIRFPFKSGEQDVANLFVFDRHLVIDQVEQMGRNTRNSSIKRFTDTVTQDRFRPRYSDIELIVVGADIVDFGKVKGRPATQILIELIPGKTLEECFDRLVDRSEPRYRSDGENEAAQVVLRLAAAIIFLSTSQDRLIEPDVLSKDLAKFASPEATPEQVTKMHDRATRRRNEGRGHTIGRRERLLRVAQARNAELPSEAGHELKHQHQRCGHIHRFHKGGGIIYKWIPQLTVRPDLPLDVGTESGVLIK